MNSIILSTVIALSTGLPNTDYIKLEENKPKFTPHILSKFPFFNVLNSSEATWEYKITENNKEFTIQLISHKIFNGIDYVCDRWVPMHASKGMFRMADVLFFCERHKKYFGLKSYSDLDTNAACGSRKCDCPKFEFSGVMQQE